MVQIFIITIDCTHAGCAAHAGLHMTAEEYPSSQANIDSRTIEFDTINLSTHVNVHVDGERGYCFSPLRSQTRTCALTYLKSFVVPAESSISRSAHRTRSARAPTSELNNILDEL